MGDHSPPPAPQRPAHQLFVALARQVGELPQPVERAVDHQPVAVLGVVALGLVGVPGLHRLRGGEVAALPSRDPPEGSAAGDTVSGHISVLSLVVKLKVSFSFAQHCAQN